MREFIIADNQDITKAGLMFLLSSLKETSLLLIAAERNLSFHTINSHRKNIFRKLGVNNVHEAIKYAMKSGIVNLIEYYI